MQQSVTSELPASSPSFASLLAALAAPSSSPGEQGEPAWNDDDLLPDVATLSYENALRTHARYRPAELDDRSLTEIMQTGIGKSSGIVAPPVSMAPDLPEFAPANPVPDRAEEAKAPVGAGREKNLKTSSITIRMSEAECAQLRQRAAEAGLTISAYLRSCTFEAEALRAQVKEALAQLRAGESTGKPRETAPARRFRFQWPPRA